ncbi:hypothetical protein AVEN_47758-1 [Araneus ventricosus]|uniref:PDZ domain-containing protein n=1 Tax=Araneus ventricosus TaxID=182803 RepID=A0A4Y2J3P9_ARAVE|nr:hypothetical protein AVEN_47758-1 [Araneus ventricosus]
MVGQSSVSYCMAAFSTTDGRAGVREKDLAEDQPEMETFEVELVKDQQGLGITIAGYVCEKGKRMHAYKSIHPHCLKGMLVLLDVLCLVGLLGRL